MADAIGKLAVITSVENAALKSGFEDALKMAARFYKALDGKSGTTTAAEGSVKRITAGLRVADTQAKSFGASLRGAIVGGIVTGGTAAVAMIGGEMLGALGGSLGDIVKDSIQIAASMETAQVAFETMAGSAEKAHDLLAELRQFAKESPLTFQQSSKVAGNILAAGIKPEQTLPTIRVLSDAARGNPEIIDRLALAYTQVRSKGHLMGQELNQFAETGLPLEQALADVLGKQKDEIRAMVEAGRVGFPDVQKALRKLTDEGGAFFGMTDKYSKTFSGQMDALKDSVEMLKGEFGKAIIEEMGLKEMASDAGAFAGRMKSVVNEARPVIRFVGDVVKAGAQLAYLGGRMTAVLGNQAVLSLMDRFPVIRETVAMIQKGLADIEAMRFDDSKVQDFAKGFFDVMSKALGKVWDSPEVQNFYTTFKTEVIYPLKKVFTDIQAGIKDIQDARKLGEDVGKVTSGSVRGWTAASTLGFSERFRSAGEKINQGTADPVALQNHIAKLSADNASQLKQGRYIGGGQFENGPSGPVSSAPPPINTDPAKPVPVEIVGENPLKAMLGGFAEMGLLKKTPKQLEIEQGRDSKIRDKYKPDSGKFLEGVEDLQKSLSEKRITDREYSMAMSDLVKGAAGDFAQRLPTAQEYGSAELAKSLAQATAGTPTNSAEAILSRMEELEKQQLIAAREIVAALGAIPKLPPVVKMPAQ